VTDIAALSKALDHASAAACVAKEGDRGSAARLVSLARAALAFPVPSREADAFAVILDAIGQDATPARTLAEIAETALRATCGRCWSGPGQPCANAGPGGMHVARFHRAFRRGLISEADYAAVALDERTAFGAGIVLGGEHASGLTAWERWNAGLPARGGDEKRRYREYGACAKAAS